MIDVVVVGAGPIGLATAAALRARNLTAILIDRGPIANTIHRYPEGMRFFSTARNIELPGLTLPSSGEKPTREEYLAYLRAYVRAFGLETRTYEEVLRIDGGVGGFHIHSRTRSGQARESAGRFVVLAVGSNETPHWLGVPGEDLPHVSHYFEDLHRYFGRRVVIVGGRNSACDAAILLARAGVAVTLIHRGTELDRNHLKYWIVPEIDGMIRRREITVHWGTTLVRIEADQVVARGPDGELRPIGCDAVLLLTGYGPDGTLFERLGIPLAGERGQPNYSAETLETSVPGIYVSGTVIGGDQNPYRVFIENAISHPDVVANAIDQAMERHGWRPRRQVNGLPRTTWDRNRAPLADEWLDGG